MPDRATVPWWFVPVLVFGAFLLGGAAGYGYRDALVQECPPVIAERELGRLEGQIDASTARMAELEGQWDRVERLLMTRKPLRRKAAE